MQRPYWQGFSNIYLKYIYNRQYKTRHYINTAKKNTQRFTRIIHYEFVCHPFCYMLYAI